MQFSPCTEVICYIARHYNYEQQAGLPEMTTAMRSALLQSLGVAVGVAVASRTSEWAFRSFCPKCSDLIQNLTGMLIAGVTAGLLFFLWRYQQRQRVLLLHERERAVKHVHHHLRNSLQVILYRTEDPLVKSQVERILREVEVALPSRPGKRNVDPV